MAPIVRGKARRLRETLRGRVAGDRGAVATEYALLLFLVALAILAGLAAFGLALVRLYSSGASAIP